MSLTNANFSYHTAGKYSRLSRSTLSGWFRPTCGGPPNASIPPFPIQLRAIPRRSRDRGHRPRRLRRRQHAICRQHRRHHGRDRRSGHGFRVSSRTAGGRTLLGGLFHATAGLRADHRGLQRHDPGQEHHLHQVVRCLRGSEPGCRRRARSRLRRLLPRARRHQARQGEAWSPRIGTRTPTQET